MNRKLSLALAASALLAASPAVLAQAQSPSSQSAQTSQSSQASKDQKSQLSKGDQKYFNEMAQSSLAEIELGKMAQEKASNDQVKQFGQRMVEDHQKMLDQQKEMADAKGLQMPQQPDRKHQRAMKKLQDQSGAKFDEAYMKDMVSDHKKDVKKVQEVAKKAKDPDLKAMAQKAVPQLQSHLQLAQQTEKTARAETRGSKSSSAGGTAGPKSSSAGGTQSPVTR